MLNTLLSKLDQTLDFAEASAHCDIPCKIYDPIVAQISALTVVRMIDIISETESDDSLSKASVQAELTRLVMEKETHAEATKHEVRVIWGDYFKSAQIEQFPQIHTLVHSIMMQGSKCKQGIDRDAALELVRLVNQFAEAFWQTKEVETFTAACPYPPNLDVVYPKLG